MNLRFRTIFVFLATLLGLAMPVFADSWPDRPVRLIVPYAPGSSADVVARAAGKILQQQLGQPFVIDNREGANTFIGVRAAARAAPDGYTLLIGTSGMTLLPALKKDLGMDLQKDLLPLTLFVAAPLMPVVSPAIPAKNLAELVAYAKSNPGKLNFARMGNLDFLAFEMFRTAHGINLVTIPYKGSGPAIQALLAGESHLSFSSIPAAAPQVDAGRLRALAVTGPKRLPRWPNIPTVAESDVPGYEVLDWFGFFAPAGTPSEVTRRFEAAVHTVLQDPEFLEVLPKYGLSPVGSTSTAFANRFEMDMKKWAAAAKLAGLKPE